MLESEVRHVVNSKRAMEKKTWVVTPKRRKKTRAIICNSHYWLVGYKGDFHADGKRPFGFMDRSATLKSSTLLENPTVPTAYRLRDPDGKLLNPYEKHMAEGIEMLSRFIDRNDAVLDFCAGTCSLGLAALYMNQRFVVLNDRDKSQLKYAEARLRAYLYAMSVSPLWRDDDMGGASPYKTPGVEVHTTWDGRDPYLPLLAALKREQIFDKILIERGNVPSSTKEKMAELYYCQVEDNEGVFLTESQPADYCFPLYGVYKRSPGEMIENQITSVLLRPMVGERKPYYMRVSDQCPWRYVRAPGEGEEANCVIQENQCGMHDLAKVVLTLTEPINVEDGEPVELLCVYDLKKLSSGWKQANVPRSAKRLHDGTKLNKTTAKKRQRHDPVSPSATTDETAEQDDENVDETSEQQEGANVSQPEDEADEEEADEEQQEEEEEEEEADSPSPQRSSDDEDYTD